MRPTEQKSLLRRIRLALYAAVIIVSATSGYATYRLSEPNPSEISGLLWPEPKTLSPFELKSTKGLPLNLERLRGNWTLLFFGFTYCPDVCPTTLSTMTDVAERLKTEEAEEAIQVVFVSVDPARDTLDRMSSYVEYFDDSFMGAVDSLEKLDDLTSQLGVLHVRGEPDDKGNYHVDHSASILLIDPELRFVGIFQAPHSAEKIATGLLSIKSFVERQS